MNKFEILRELRCEFPLKVGLITYDYRRHSTGEHLDIYLRDGSDELHVYYETNWFSSRYLFNERDKKVGYLVDNAPWNQIIQNQFKLWEKEIVDEKQRKILEEAEIVMAREERELSKIESFKKKFESLNK